MSQALAAQAKDPLVPVGLQAIHANHLEDLRQMVVWLTREYPIPPLENEVFLVQSNGIAQWLKLALAENRSDEGGGCGISAANTFLLPHRFVWQAYRSVLAEDAIPERSPFDRERLVWRLFRLLPELTHESVFTPLARFLGGARGDQRLYQLSQRLAELYEQYGVFRADWLSEWADGSDRMRPARGKPQVLPEDLQWQPELWRRLIDDMANEPGYAGSRASIHERFKARGLTMAAHDRPRGLPRRIVVFGVSSLPQQTLEVLDVLGRFSQVVLCVHNPCQFYWADIVSDRDLLRATRRRAARKAAMPPDLDDSDMHLHAQPLLAAWGKQGRDYIRLLDEFDDPEVYRSRFHTAGQRVDIFRAPEGEGLLHQLQDDIVSLRPCQESREQWPPVDPARDRSIVFHVAHSPQRELEILHDQLLAAFSADKTLRPRDIMVMVPDINSYAPGIQAVFGRHAEDEYYSIPFTISDQGLRHRQPLVVALENLLSLPDSRFGAVEVMTLLEVPAVRARFGIEEGDLPQLLDWINGANIYWGLDAGQRAKLGLPQDMHRNTWRFGLERMILGYSVGDSEAWSGIEPYGEIGGLEAHLAGLLHEFVGALDWLWQLLQTDCSPQQWVDRLAEIQARFFQPEDQGDLLMLVRVQDAVAQWHSACREARLDQDDPEGESFDIPLAIVREVWIEGLEDKGLNQRFLAGRVNFATLMPMRAIPFRYVCLLGMNDGDYPRSRPPVDFDLMGKDYRPGDRSRREDDRYLFLEAMLSAREQLYVSWVGRSIKDNAALPPSVLVAQMRDHINDCWRLDHPPAATGRVSDALTTEHPLQPFSRAYFPDRSNAGADDAEPAIQSILASRALFSFDHTWRSAHRETATSFGAGEVSPYPSSHQAAGVDDPVQLNDLARFLRHPVQYFYQRRLGIDFSLAEHARDEAEVFELDGLGKWALQDELISDVVKSTADPDEMQTEARRLIDRMAAQGRLGMGSTETLLHELVAEPLHDLHERFHKALARWPISSETRITVSYRYLDAAQPNSVQIEVEDTIDDLRENSQGHLCRLVLMSSSLIRNPGKSSATYQYKAMLNAWVIHVAAHLPGGEAASTGMTTELVSKNGSIVFSPLSSEQADTVFRHMLAAWVLGIDRPLPLSVSAGFAAIGGSSREGALPAILMDAAEAAYAQELEYDDGYLQRAFPDFTTMAEDPLFTRLVRELYCPLKLSAKATAK
ncbi:exodeoxyribonuclease V subunit gamma [Allohahella marinimesophila]|uniref:RecBCD enzyme subunit RecC n=1 Tax=Allohahella marinimesophila TaxID=1054972 RepID=A0ABP7NHY5_9GAMM